MRLSPHAMRQVAARGLSQQAVTVVVRAAYSGTGHEAIRVGRLPSDRGGLIGSNGNELWAIVRDGVLVTVMFRRSTQPRHPYAFDVDRVVV